MNKLYFPLAAALFVIVIVMRSGFLSADQKVFEQKCARCHSLRVPDNYSKTEWKYNVERMAARAGLTPAEIKSVIELNKKK